MRRVNTFSIAGQGEANNQQQGPELREASYTNLREPLRAKFVEQPFHALGWLGGQTKEPFPAMALFLQDSLQ